jgi:hypothetical protein
MTLQGITMEMFSTNSRKSIDAHPKIEGLAGYIPIQPEGTGFIV